MRLNKIAISGFIGIRNLTLDPVADLTLVCGWNRTGKTSMAQAIGLALRGLPERVKLKKDYGELVHDDFDEASIVMDMGEQQAAVRIKKKTAKADGLPNPDNISQALHAALDMYHFPNLDDNARRSLLFRLGGVRASVEEVRKLLIEGGAVAGRIDKVEHYLQAGFEAAEKAAKDYASDARKEWKRLTGEAYGKDKAEGWQKQCEPAEEDPALKAAVEDIHAKLIEARGTLSEAKGAESHKNALQRRLEEQSVPDADAEELARKREAAQAEVVEHQDQVQSLREQLQEARGEAAPASYECPDCEAQLMMVEGKLVAYEEPESDPGRAASLEEEIEIVEQALRQKRDAVSQLNNQIQAIQTAADLKKQLEEMPGSEVNQGVLAEEIAKLESDLAGRKQALADNQAAVEAYRQAEEVTKAAAAAHDDAREWDHLAGLLAPDGVPNIILQKALGPFNVCLKEMADLSGWAPAEVDTNMLITYGGRSYGLLSESEQWRAAAMIAAAISYLSGVNFLLLDRADILDVNTKDGGSRGQMVRWIKALKEKGMQVIVCATLKEAPEVEGIETVWMDNAQEEKAA